MKVVIKRTITDDISAEKIVDLFLEDRGLKNNEDFLHPKHPTDIQLRDFFDNKKIFDNDLKKTIQLLKTIKKEQKTIVVYTDYDADGITGGAILWETLFLLGFKVMPYVPDRKREGYGFSKKGIDAVYEKYNPALIISVDHGIAAAEKITYAKSLGIPIVVTDHHMKSSVAPDDAFSIFHTDMLSGSGVSYFFSKSLFDHFKNESNNITKLSHYFDSDYLHLASIGTIADLVPLLNGSRSIVYYGLKHFSECNRPGLKHIMKEAKIQDKEITPFDIGFIIAPRINAIGRLDNALDALRLLCTPSDAKAKELAQKISGFNKNRQDLVKKAVEEAEDLVVKNNRQSDSIIVVHSDEISGQDSYWNEGIIGLIASRLTEDYYRPSIVLTKSDGFLKASARSIPGFDITSFLRSLQKYLVDVGGHTQAAGFTIEATKLDPFIRQVIKKSKTVLSKKDLEKTIEIDMEIPIPKINLSLLHLFEKLKPFGMGNKEPVFLSNVVVTQKKLLGKNSQHLKLLVKQKDSSRVPMEVLAFSKGHLFDTFTIGNEINIAYRTEINIWNGRESVVGRFVCVI
jgi:single-stranded-DNA-specific exonuclease